ncbi:alanyl-tRNA synthetase [Hydromonas duriensis]|uniref:Alanine--tRNA ligase n=1 Tax=Hydromonas duriensis TaxID=1527608 RepID=A0A4R6Y9T4_9BURK|nr:alanine--tRNA ligase [Hydromonas duriensis]TDR32221.1 alanyl-tRNA synthetase [Hydromonas duriensis]
MQVADIRQKFLDFFEQKGHTVVRSSSLVPGNDPTLMFTNSGMVQFKDVFLGTDKRPYNRATSVQACLRAGGKHNDLENVGYTARHHTFFEMLGNWSFGDYFKRESLQWAWELLTQVYQLPAEKLYATVYMEDDEAYGIWENIFMSAGFTKERIVSENRIIRIGDNKGGRYMSDNFWMMADTGPCGPCSEIFYDHGDHIAGGLPGTPEEDGDRYIEIWNNVFMQFDMQLDGSVKPLPAPCVDTGMGLERLAAILQHVHSNYEIDLFANLIQAASRETGCTDLKNPSLNVIADHIRACSFLIVDGVIPSNEGRGYVLRRIIRRAIRHGYKLGVRKPFFSKLVKDLVKEMGAAYPDLAAKESLVTQALHTEEKRFFETIETGMQIFDREVECATIKAIFESKKSVVESVKFTTLTDLNVSARYFECKVDDKVYAVISEKPDFDVDMFGKLGKNRNQFDEVVSFSTEVLESVEGVVLAGDVIFLLHDTFGFPADLTEDMCREKRIVADMLGYNAAMNAQKDASRAAGKFKMNTTISYDGAKTDFKGYSDLTVDGAKVTGIYIDGVSVEQMTAGQSGIVILDQTPFYAESGGQVGDAGQLSEGKDCAFFAQVSDTTKVLPDVFGHHVQVEAGQVSVGDQVTARVDGERRAATMRNHSATHLLHKALRTVLGEHVQQKGSLVDADKTRFDFAHNAPVSADDIVRIETFVNQEILQNGHTQAQVMAFDDAKETGAMMLFGEKYGDEVRVLSIGSSVELCGGTHVHATGDIGLFKVTSEGGVAAGVRRIEAVTGMNAVRYTQSLAAQLSQAAGALKAAPSELVERIQGTQEQIKTLEKELTAAKAKIAAAQGGDLAAQAVDVNGVKVLAALIDGADIDMLRNTMDSLKDKLGSAVIVLATASDKATILAGVTKDLTAKIKAGDVVNHVAAQVGGKGGGRPDMAQAGGTDVAALPAAMASVQGFVTAKL